jgi:hypothetical protein
MPDPRNPLVRVTLAPEWIGQDPVRVELPGEVLPIDMSPADFAVEYHVPADIADEIQAWDDEFQAAYRPDDPAASGFPDEQTMDRWVERGLRVARRLAAELGPLVPVEVRTSLGDVVVDPPALAASPPLRVDFDDVDFDDGVTYIYDGRPLTGEVVETDHDGNVIELTPVVDGRANGVDRTWYSDGTLRIETTVVDGRATGTSRMWHPNGRLAEERDFNQRGDLVAIRWWDEDGNPVEREPGRAAGPDR